jgi:hypothetical protein
MHICGKTGGFSRRHRRDGSVRPGRQHGASAPGARTRQGLRAGRDEDIASIPNGMLTQDE